MNHIREEIQELNDCINELETDKDKKILSKVFNILNDITEKIEELTINQEAIEENLEYMDDDLSGIQEELFEEVSLEELTEIEDEYKEIKCMHCNKPVFVETSAIEKNNNIPCPYCNHNMIK